MRNTRIIIDKKLRWFLAHKGWSQMELSRLTGIPQSTITNWINRPFKTPRMEHLLALQRISGLPVEWWADQSPNLQ